MLKDDSTPVLHLICNAHLDPIWLWEWPEGAAEALSTFRSAADLCEEHGELIFNHNEVQLYEWIEEYEPALFQRIQRLVAEDKWHIMGGWFLQPDMNMPSAESIIRQILLGHRYFGEKFNKWPSTAICFDAFGHSRGVVQLLSQSGQDSYLFCRPNQQFLPLESHEFVWEGYDGSRVLAVRAEEHYHSYLGKAREKVELCIKRHLGEIHSAAHGLGVENLSKGERPCTNIRTTGHCLWGVGNHGGGPSRIDLQAIRDLSTSEKRMELRHSTPEAYFADLAHQTDHLPCHRGDLNLWAPGCYISQALVKQGHRRLEQALFLTEKMASQALMASGMVYPAKELREATRDLCISEFHDILPGSSIPEVEAHALQLMGHGREILSRVRTRAFFALCSGQTKAKENQIPVLAYNPHPYPVAYELSCEFNLPDQNWETSWTQIKLRDENGNCVPVQIEQESSNLSLDWRKKIVFRTTLPAGKVSRFNCEPYRVKERSQPELPKIDDYLYFQGEQISANINLQDGLIENLVIDNRRVDAGGFLRPCVHFDNADPWGSEVEGFDRLAGFFDLLSPEKAAQLCNQKDRVAPVRVVEDGEVRTLIEAYFGYGNSTLVITYSLPKKGTEIGVDVRVFWHEKDRLLSLDVPQPDIEKTYYGQSMGGWRELDSSGKKESVIQQWAAVRYPGLGAVLAVMNDGTYSVGCSGSSLQLRLLRSPAYAALTIPGRPLLPENRFRPRIDQGERTFHFWLTAGSEANVFPFLDSLALIHNQNPMVLSFFPSGQGEALASGPQLDNPCILLQAFKQAEDGSGFILRFFNPTSDPQTAQLTSGTAKGTLSIDFKPFEIKSFWQSSKGKYEPCNLLEKTTPKPS